MGWASAYKPCFTSTSSWLYKGLNLALVVTSTHENQLVTPLMQGVFIVSVVLVYAAIFPSLLHSVRSRHETTVFIAQLLLYLSAIGMILSYLRSHQHVGLMAVTLQFLTAHCFYTAAMTLIRNKTLLTYGAFIGVAFLALAVLMPVLASFSGPRPQTHGLYIAVFLAMGEIVGVAVYAVYVLIALLGSAYEQVMCFMLSM